MPIGFIGRFALIALECAGYPLAPRQTSDKCLCPQHEGSGWSSEQDRCLSSSITSCLECPSQQWCAKLKDLAGDGLQIFWGDCRSSTCTAATESSFAFAVSIAVDQENNIFFTDSGNNRIRMLDAKLNALITIAGTGEVGFAGDGKLGRDALLRHPEGLALKPNTQGQEVYFSDFLNQRLRKLVKSESGSSGSGLTQSTWLIYTVAGTGVMAEDTSCNDGCVPLEASLWNPRALAFASNQDLYFIESGSSKILRLSTSLGDPSLSSNATLIAFAGHNSKVSPYGFWPSFRGFAKVALPGHYSVPNANLAISGMYSIGIDRKDRLWLVDSDNNRIFMLPLTNGTDTELLGDFGRFLARFDASFFVENVSTYIERQALRASHAEALKLWLPVEFPTRNLSLKVESSAERFQYGYSYWIYGAPVTGQTWCQSRDIQSFGGACDVSAQLAKFGGILSVCFDPADNMYLVDNEDSQIVYLEDDSQFQHSAAPTTEKTTDPGCPCEMHWIEDYRSTDGEVMLPGVARFIPDDLIARRVCRENPDLERIISQQYAGNQAEIEAIISKTPTCTAVDYCAAGHSDHYPKWCYVSARNLPDSEFKNLCSEYTWFWCNAAEQRPTAARWKLLPGATLLGNEKRFETIYLFELSGFELMRPQLSEDLWLTSKMPYDYSIDSSRAQQSGFFLAGTGILKGFVDTGSGQARCGEYCCGLPILREHNTSTGVSGFICLLRNLSDLPVMETYYQETQPNTQQGPGPPGSPAPPSVVPVPVLTVFEELESLVYGIRPSVDEAATDKLDYCKSRCLYDESCSGYMIKGSGSTPELMSPGQPCIFFSQNQPFYVYTISRTGAPFSNGFVNMSISLEKFQALQAFVGPGIPASRLTGDQDGIYVTDSLVGSKDMISGPHLDQSLLLIECQELCLENIECTGIAFPGCYLINKTTIKLLSGSSYSLMVKEKVQPVVKGTIGYSEADSYNNESRAQQSYLNRPLSCAVDSAGDFIFADNNHRIRKISGWATSCSMAGEFSIHQVQLYESSLVQADAACNNASVPALQELYVQAQQDVLENNSLDLVQQYFCNFGASNFSTQMQSFTNNVYILCTACASLSPRPPACPWQALCDCRDAMVQVATQDVHIMCPQRNAQVDPWHRWITSYTSCWMSDSDAIQWNDANKMASLQDQLQRQSL